MNSRWARRASTMATMSSSARPALAQARIMSSTSSSTGLFAARSAPTEWRSATNVPRPLRVALALQVHVGAVHRVVADIQINRERAHRGKPVARRIGARADKVGDAVLDLYPYRQAGVVVDGEGFKGVHGISLSSLTVLSGPSAPPCL